MIQIKKTILTLALLITAVTGAWADQLASSYSSNATLNAVTVSASMEVTIATGVTVTINNGLNITSGTLTVKGPGTLVVNGKAGSNGGGGVKGGNGTPGSAAITGNIEVMDNATIQANGGAGGNGGASGPEIGGHGANGAAAISGNVTVLGGATVIATGGNGGNGGYADADTGGNGGNGGNAFAGTLTYKGGTVTANGGNGGSGGEGDGGYDNGSGGSAGKAFTTSVNFVSSDYILTDGSNAITATQVTSKKKVVISPKVAVNSVTLAPTSATLTLGETETLTLTATVDPTNATDPTVKWNVTAGADKVKLYKDENCSTEVGTAATDVLTVYAKCLAVGEATVTVTSNDDATKTAACTVTVIPSGPEVAWTASTKTGTFTMPGGNVTLEPEYYPQAALAAAPTAINDVPATTDGAIVEAGTVANIGETTTAQGTVMYYVSQTTLDDAALLALAADQWTADVPTAADLAQGPAYVYYYVRGNDSDTDAEIFSDGDILATNKVAVTIAAAPTYAVTFADDMAEPDKWTASPAADVKKGQTVTVTYTGTKKVIGVKAEKKAAGPNEVLTYSFDDASHPSGLTAGSRVSFDYSRTSVITNSKFLNAHNNTNGDPDATTISLGDTDLSGETWTLSFEWAACGGCNSKPDHTTLKAGNATLFDLSGNSNWNTTVTIIYTGSDGSKTLPVPGCDKSNRFTEAVVDQYNTTTYWHHIVVTGSSEGVKMTITNSSTGAAVVEDVVLSETNVNPTSLIIEPCCGGGIGIDALSLTYEE